MKKNVDQAVDVTSLFTPIKIGNVAIKNRIAFSPTCTDSIEPGGFVGDRMRCFYAARAKGGVGLIFTGPAMIEPELSHVPYLNAFLYRPEHVPGWSEFAETMHAFGAKTFVQCDPGGAGRLGTIIMGEAALAPSAIPVKLDPEYVVQKKAAKLWAKRGLDLAKHYHIGKEFPAPREITVEGIQQRVDKIANQVELCEWCGFDGAELHFAHGALGSNFLSPRTNTRTDQYGGSLENRCRYMTEILEKARKKISSNFALGIRVSSAERLPGGLTAEDTAEICKYVEDLIDFVDLSVGIHHESHAHMIPEEDGTVIDEAAIIKSRLKVPVICPSVHSPVLGNNAIKNNKTDMIGLSRGLIADPEWANKAREGKPYVKCIKCILGCTGRIDIGMPLRCEVNPHVLQEYLQLEYYRLNAPHKRTYTIR
jgi:2,4-dienoyl-CoA reductase-like NADH-dependent reductase (Old Yellow Enzyme family)